MATALTHLYYGKTMRVIAIPVVLMPRRAGPGNGASADPPAARVLHHPPGISDVPVQAAGEAARRANSSAAGDLCRIRSDPVLGRYLGHRAAATWHFRTVRRRAAMRHSVARGTARCLRAFLRCAAIAISGMTARPASPPDAGYHIWHDRAGYANCRWLSMKRRLPALDPIRSLTRYSHCD
jgi:hypothetical protein